MRYTRHFRFAFVFVFCLFVFVFCLFVLFCFPTVVFVFCFFGKDCGSHSLKIQHDDDTEFVVFTMDT